MAAVGLIGVREAEQPAATEPRVGALAVVGHDRAPAAGRRRACGSTSTGGGISGSPPGGNVDGSIWRMACRPSPAERIRQVAAAVDQALAGIRAHRGDGVDAAVPLADLEIQREAGRRTGHAFMRGRQGARTTPLKCRSRRPRLRPDVSRYAVRAELVLSPHWI